MAEGLQMFPKLIFLGNSLPLMTISNLLYCLNE